MDRVFIALALGSIATFLALLINKRNSATVPPVVADRSGIPMQVDRNDFPRPDAPYLVVLFSSSACDSCSGVAEKVAVLESPNLATFIAEYSTFPELHKRYGIDAVPMVIVVDSLGVTQASFLGQVSATDLWAAVANARTTESLSEKQ